MTQEHDIVKLTIEINKKLVTYSPKDWNYSRITLIPRSLDTSQSPYMLWIDVVNTQDAAGKKELNSLAAEVKWGARHSNELGILELVSLRLNRALLESTTDADWDFQRPVIRLVAPETFAHKGITTALWYEITELAGDEFDNR